jgi:hypothetical protein
LEKAGIAVVKVAKDGTSQVDPVTGEIGYRDGNHLYVIRDGKLGWVPADPAASLNILIRGLNHSVSPYKIRAIGLDSKEELGKRASRFLKVKYGGTYFVQNEAGIMVVKKPKGEENVLHNVPVYFHGGKLSTVEQHLAEIEAIKHLVEIGTPCTEFSLTDCGEQGYMAFPMK